VENDPGVRYIFPLRWCAAPLGLLAAALAIVPPAVGASSSASKRSAESVRRAITDCTNRERARYGLRPFRQSEPLERAAQYHARNMQRDGFFSHDDPSGRDAFDRIAMFQKRGAFTSMGENIAAGYRTGLGVCQSWLRSAKHRRNILNRRFTHLGVGFASGDGEYRTYFVQDFGGGLAE
jgi:uncharacterized protein YkwD